MKRCPWQLFARSEKAFRIRRFMSKFLGVSFLSSASKKVRTWEHWPGTLCKLLLSRSFSERSKAFGKGVLSRSSLGCSLSVSEAKTYWGTHLGTQSTYHLKLLFWNSFSEHPSCGMRKNVPAFWLCHKCGAQGPPQFQKRSENVGWNFGSQPMPGVAPSIAPRIGFSYDWGRMCSGIGQLQNGKPPNPENFKTNRQKIGKTG